MAPPKHAPVGGVLSKLVQLNRILDGGLGHSLEPLDNFHKFFEKITFSAPF